MDTNDISENTGLIQMPKGCLSLKDLNFGNFHSQAVVSNEEGLMLFP